MKLTAAIVWLGALAIAPAVRAESLYDSFQAVCIKTTAMPQEALGAAQAQGWGQLPEQLATQVSKGLPQVSGAFQGRMSTAAKRFMITGDATFPFGAKSIKVRVCAVAGAPADGEQVGSEVSAYAGVPAYPGGPAGETTFGFVEDGGKHVLIPNPDDEHVMLQLAENGRGRAVFVGEQPGLAILGLAVPVK